VSFVALGLTGLNITFGKIVLLPLIGPDAFSRVSELAKYVHNFSSFRVHGGLVLIVLIFFKDNLPERVDIDWLRQGGGFIKGKHAPAGRFNLGEKLVYWLSLAAGVAVSVSGFCCCFPSTAPISPICSSPRSHMRSSPILFVALILATSISARSAWRVRSKPWHR